MKLTVVVYATLFYCWGLTGEIRGEVMMCLRNKSISEDWKSSLRFCRQSQELVNDTSTDISTRLAPISVCSSGIGKEINLVVWWGHWECAVTAFSNMASLSQESNTISKVPWLFLSLSCIHSCNFWSQNRLCLLKTSLTNWCANIHLNYYS